MEILADDVRLIDVVVVVAVGFDEMRGVPHKFFTVSPRSCLDGIRQLK